MDVLAQEPLSEPFDGELLAQVLADTTGMVNEASPSMDMVRHTARVEKKNFLLGATEIVAVNLFVMGYNRYISGQDFTKVSWYSFWENIRNGFEWDPNKFTTNQFAHPYHGNLYYNAGRSNGYDFWESVPFAFAGSFLWEYFGETHNPAYNDWIATSVGGTTMGEALWRFSDLVLDNTATGSSRGWRELGGIFLNPIRGFTRLVTGRAFEQFPNPEDRIPDNFNMEYMVGVRTVGEERVWETDTTRVFLNFDFDYGDAFDEEIDKPFDHFAAELQINFDDASGIGQLQIEGFLAGADLRRTRTTTSRIAAYQHYDFINNNAIEFAGQATGASFLTRLTPSEGLQLDMNLHSKLYWLAATTSDYRSFTARNYDYGPGIGYKFLASLWRNNRPLFEMSHEQYWILTVNGTESTHEVAFTRARLDIPIRRQLGVGAEYYLYHTKGKYENFEDVTRTNPEVRGFFSWVID